MASPSSKDLLADRVVRAFMVELRVLRRVPDEAGAGVDCLDRLLAPAAAPSSSSSTGLVVAAAVEEAEVLVRAARAGTAAAARTKLSDRGVSLVRCRASRLRAVSPSSSSICSSSRSGSLLPDLDLFDAATALVVLASE